MAASFQRLLVCRTDALGDAILTLPLLQALKKNIPQAKLTFLVSPVTAPLFHDLPCIDQLWVYDPQGQHQGGPGFRQLVRSIQAERFEAVLMVYPDRRLSWAMVRAAVPRRVGTGRRWWSWMYTLRLKHSRKTVTKHEADYNLDLLRVLGFSATLEHPELKVRKAQLDEVNHRLQALGHHPGHPLIVVHAGGRGSAANWQPEAYAALVAKLMAKVKGTILLTGTGAELALADRIATLAGREATGEKPSQVVVMRPPVALEQLPALLASSTMVVCGNTGPMHIAAAVGTPLAAIFPPAGVTGPKRWGPLANEAMVFTPASGDAQAFRHGISAVQLDPEMVAGKILQWLQTHQGADL